MGPLSSLPGPRPDEEADQVRDQNAVTRLLFDSFG